MSTVQAIPDVPALVVAYLKTGSIVTSLVGQRIYAEEIPRAELDAWRPNEARACIVVQSSAGGFQTFGRTFIRAGNSRIDLRCYGPDARTAGQIWNAAYPWLKHAKRSVVGSRLLYAAMPLIERTMLREPDTGFWFAWGAFDIIAAEIPVPA